MKKQHKKYSKPRRLFDKTRIEEEDEFVEKYGLKNKREIWKAESAIARMRNKAKKLIIAGDKEKKAFIALSQKKGFKVEKIADVLSLNKEDWLKRRLQTIVHKKSLANTPKQARQFITHKHILIGNQVVNIPSYQVSLEEEPLIELKLSLKNKENKKDRLEEIKEEILSNEKESEKNIGE